jgi:hypothetical protein
VSSTVIGGLLFDPERVRPPGSSTVVGPRRRC